MPAEKPKIVMYGHPACPVVYPLEAMLKKSGVNYDYINIREDENARQRVRDINNGDESVPTLVFPDGSTLTEPSPTAIQTRLSQFGYHPGWQAKLSMQSPRLVMAFGLALVLMKLLHVF
jgi:mycoredoxin